jgi:hypothetical protein
VCRKALPNDPRKAKAGRWRNISITLRLEPSAVIAFLNRVLVSHLLPMRALGNGLRIFTTKRCEKNMETSKNQRRPVCRRPPHIGLSDLYPLPVRRTLFKLLWAARGCDEAIDYVQRSSASPPSTSAQLRIVAART